MPEIPAKAVMAAAIAIERELLSGKDYSMAQDSDEALARVALEAAAPLLAETVRREIVAAIREHSRARHCDFCGRLGEGAELKFRMQRLDRVCGVDHAADFVDASSPQTAATREDGGP